MAAEGTAKPEQRNEQGTGGSKEAHQDHARGTMSAWIAVGVMLLGFTVGGLGLVLGSWLMFGVGVVVTGLGGIYGMATGIMEQVH